MAASNVGAAAAAALKFVRGVVETNPVALFGKTYCPFTRKVRVLFNELGAKYKETDLDVVENGDILQLVLTKATGQPTVPYVFIGGDFIGGADEVVPAREEDADDCLDLYTKQTYEGLEEVRMTAGTYKKVTSS
ncbi:hypothetical protein KFL_002350020 [Klebsormidium nitens]|uniref:Glutaredoxin domain-containing protein n=1 Tax=Klebsormidium nitens TaxID=105231 RepID=A0A1Y1IBG8_KLENI|nr:hypothetical protein KFL_002350020 [Klebsormidium nitens]|eukprot:GAQ85428.1 hypothetical protein KFL_002350020 [Klebsormidium nitens]